MEKESKQAQMNSESMQEFQEQLLKASDGLTAAKEGLLNASIALKEMGRWGVFIGVLTNLAHSCSKCQAKLDEVMTYLEENEFDSVSSQISQSHLDNSVSQQKGS
tara:strand:- start:84 stop:398 length:315 start_codon:yes stop_codon:yes gene_type:complete